MPSPIAHISFGCIVWQILKEKIPDLNRPMQGASVIHPLLVRIETVLRRMLPFPRSFSEGGWLLFGATLLFSMLPDIDALPGFLFGNLGKYHNNMTHSLLVGAAVALATAGCARLLRLPAAGFWGLLALLSYSSHVVMDCFTGGRGVMLLWPLTAHRFQSPVLIFYGLQWAASPLDPAHWLTVINELGFAGILWGAIRLRRHTASAHVPQ